jgi:hypothetical protein
MKTNKLLCLVLPLFLLALASCAENEPKQDEPQTPPPPASKVITEAQKPSSITLAMATKGLASQFALKSSPSEHGQKVRMGRSKESKAVLKVIGNDQKISEIVFTVPKEDVIVIGPKDRKLLQKIFANFAPDWKERNKWLESAIYKSTTGEPVEKRLEHVSFKVNFISLTELVQITAEVH